MSVRKLEKLFILIGKVMGLVAALALIVMVLITILDVFLKNIFLAPIPGALEITRMMMVCMAPAFVTVLMHNRHVSVGLFVDKLSRKWQVAFDVFGYLSTSALLGLMCYQSFVMMQRRMVQNQVYTSLKIPYWPFWLLFAVSVGVFAVAVLVKLAIIIMDKDIYSKPHREPSENPAAEAVLSAEGEMQ